jgi:hypothetical protein
MYLGHVPAESAVTFKTEIAVTFDWNHRSSSPEYAVTYRSEKLARLGAQETGLNLYKMQF